MCLHHDCRWARLIAKVYEVAVLRRGWLGALVTWQENARRLAVQNSAGRKRYRKRVPESQICTQRSRFAGSVSSRSIHSYRHTHLDLLSRAWKLRDNISAYDAMYVALAQAIDAPVVTCDGPLGKGPGHRARIEIVA